MTPDRYGHADAWWSPPAPPGADADRWAHEHRARFAAELFVEGESRRAERIEQAAALLEAPAARYRNRACSDTSRRWAGATSP